MELTVLGFHFRNSSLERREALGIVPERVPDFLQTLIQRDGIQGAVFLSTCNRLELYVAAQEGMDARFLISAWVQFLGRTEETIKPDTFFKGAHAFKHLVEVAAGLDSMVLGEPQVLGQVKEAYLRALELKVSGPLLNFAFQQAFRIAKQVRTQTGIARYPVSVSTVALLLLEQIFGDFKEVTALVVGLGEIGEQTAKLLSERNPKKMIVMNRTLQRAHDFALRWKMQACPLDAMDTILPMVDMVITSTRAPAPILSCAQIKEAMAQRSDKPLVLMDLGFPRDVETGSGNCDNVYLYNVDDLKGIAEKNLGQREREARLAQAIIEKEIAFFGREWIKRAGISENEKWKIEGNFTKSEISGA